MPTQRSNFPHHPGCQTKKSQNLSGILPKVNMLLSTSGATIMQSAVPFFSVSLQFCLFVVIGRADMFAAVTNGPLRHFMMILTYFMRNSGMCRKLFSIAVVRTAEALDVLDGKCIDRMSTPSI